jgi:hypothetical protein
MAVNYHNKKFYNIGIKVITVLVAVGATDDRGSSSSISGHTEGVGEALGLHSRTGTSAANAAADKLDIGVALRGARAGNDKVGEINSKLKRGILSSTVATFRAARVHLHVRFHGAFLRCDFVV